MGEDTDEILRRAGREARKAATRARDLASLLDELSARLEADEGAAAAELRRRARSKFFELREALSGCEDWARMAESWGEAHLVATES